MRYRSTTATWTLYVLPVIPFFRLERTRPGCTCVPGCGAFTVLLDQNGVVARTISRDVLRRESSSGEQTDGTASALGRMSR